MYRIGYGYDVHRLVENRKLILGGVEIPHRLGLLGHSDADVLLHAIIDALLGALAIGDIGVHFPDTDEAYNGVDSRVLLRKTYDLVTSKDYRVNNIDATICAQEPKLASYIFDMRVNIAEDMNCDVGCVSVKATTEERLGISGSEQGITAHCVVMLICG